MKKLSILASVLMVAIFGLATMSWAQEASVFDDLEKIIIRAYTTGGPGTYSVYLEVRDSTGALLVPEDPQGGVSVKDVTGTSFTPAFDLQYNRYIIHDNDASSPEISMSLDSELGTLYLFCTNGGVMVRKYNIINNNIVNGACGATLDTCTSGTFVDVTDTTTDNLWKCAGSNNGSDSPTCSLAKVNGACGAALNACTSGTFQDVADTSTYNYWNCNGANEGTNALSCSLAKVNGACGATLNACTSGTFQDVNDTSTYNYWNCNGANGGTNALSCSLAKVNGACGATLNACTSGTFQDVGDTSTNYLWNCNGTNGGTNALSCSLPIPSGSPDLRLASFTGVASSYEAGMTLRITVTITNQGNASTEVANACTNKQIAVKAYQGSNLAGTWYVSDLTVGQNLSHTFTVLADETCSIHSYCSFTAKVDADGCITESNEDNNLGGRASLRGR